jgi:KDO2-lipid IV(A) lauroyltransferase
VAAEDVASSLKETVTQPSSASDPQGRRKKVIRPAREKKKAVARCEYVLVRGLLWFFRLLPFPLAFRVGEAIGWLLYHCDRPHRRVGLLNLELAFPHKSEVERRQILRASLRNLGRLVAEFCHMHTLTKDNISERVGFTDFALWQKLLAQTQSQHTGALILSGHFGNWELLAYAQACYGVPIQIIHRRLRNGLVDDLIVQERERCGNHVIRKTTAGIEVFRAIRQKALVVVAVDQNASGRMGVFIPFFSRLASTSTGLAGLALASNAPVVPAFLIRENGTWRHHIVVLPPVAPVRTGDQEADLRATTAKFTEVFQQMVEQYPDHWLWIHKRWKRRPDGEASIY